MTSISVEVPLRRCYVCGLECLIEEDLTLFAKDDGSKHGRENRCKACEAARHREGQKRTIEIQGKAIRLPVDPRTGTCSICHRSYPDELKRRTCMHHTTYDKPNPLDHTVEMCSPCHTRLHNYMRRGGAFK